MGSPNSDQQAGDEKLVWFTRASVVDAPHVAAADRGRADALIPVDAYLVPADSDVVEYLRVRSGPDARPTDLHYVAPHLVGRAVGADEVPWLNAVCSSTGDFRRAVLDTILAATRPGYYEAATGRLFIDRPVKRSDLALYQVGDLRRAGVIR